MSKFHKCISAVEKKYQEALMHRSLRGSTWIVLTTGLGLLSGTTIGRVMDPQTASWGTLGRYASTQEDALKQSTPSIKSCAYLCTQSKVEVKGLDTDKENKHLQYFFPPNGMHSFCPLWCINGEKCLSIAEQKQNNPYQAMQRGWIKKHQHLENVMQVLRQCQVLNFSIW